jgi:hypothetical protein
MARQRRQCRNDDQKVPPVFRRVHEVRQRRLVVLMCREAAVGSTTPEMLLRVFHA